MISLTSVFQPVQLLFTLDRPQRCSRALPGAIAYGQADGDQKHQYAGEVERKALQHHLARWLQGIKPVNSSETGRTPTDIEPKR